MKKILGLWRSLHMVLPIGRSVKIYCIWSIFGIWRRSIAFDLSLAFEDRMHLINLWNMKKIYCIWSIFGIEDLCIWSLFGIWRSIAYDQYLAYDDLLCMINLWNWRSLYMIYLLAYEDLWHINNLWHLRSIAYDQSLVLKIVAYDSCYMKIFFAYLSWSFGRWRRSLHAMPFVAGVDSKHALFEGVPTFSAIQITLAISVFGKKRSGRRDAVVVVFQILKFLLIVVARFRFGLKAK